MGASVNSHLAFITKLMMMSSFVERLKRLSIMMFCFFMMASDLRTKHHNGSFQLPDYNSLSLLDSRSLHESRLVGLCTPVAFLRYATNNHDIHSPNH